MITPKKQKEKNSKGGKGEGMATGLDAAPWRGRRKEKRVSFPLLEMNVDNPLEKQIAITAPLLKEHCNRYK